MSVIKFLIKLALSLLGLLSCVYGFYLILALWISKGEFFAGLVVIGICFVIYGVVSLWD